MSTQLNQTLMMIRVCLFTLPRRLAISVSMALSVALVVCVLAGFLSIAKGFEAALTSAGSETVAVLLGGGGNQENVSELPASFIRTLEAMEDDFGVARDTSGNLVSSRELIVPVEVEQKPGGRRQTLTLRGMDAAGTSIRDGISLSSGRIFSSGAREIVIGERLATDFPVLQIGRSVRLGTVDWKVVGYFSARGSAFESEIWSDLEAVRAAFDRQGLVQSLRLRLTSPTALAPLRDRLATISGTPVIARSEADLYADQSDRTAGLIRLFGWPIALLMAIGAIAGALNTMLTSVSDRTIEIATVRALGFSRFSTFVATWIEAVVLAAVGATTGILASWLVFNGWQASTIGVNNASLVFQLQVTAEVMLSAGLLGLAIGIIGGALPAIAASRLPLTSALRGGGRL